MVAALFTSVWLRLHALGTLSLGGFASEEVITRIELLIRGMKDCKTGRLRVVKLLASIRRSSINLNNDAEYETGVEDGNFGEQSAKLRRIRCICCVLSCCPGTPKDQHVGGEKL